MHQFEDKLRERVAPFVEALEAEGFEASVFHPSEYGIKVSISKDGCSIGPVVVYYKSSEDTFSVSDHEMKDASAFDHFESLFYQSEEHEPLPGYHAFVDGSYQHERIGYGWVVYRDGTVSSEDFGTVEAFEDMRQVVGELKATVEALKWCEENDVNSVHLHYDFEGIKKWPSGEWKAKNALTNRFKHVVEECPVDITWAKEEAHTGVTGNEHADRLAKKGTEPEESAKQPGEGKASASLIDELETTVEEFLRFVDTSHLPEGVELNPRQVYNDDYYRLEVVQREDVSGRFDLYNTPNKSLEPRLHGFESKELQEQLQALWDEFSGDYVDYEEVSMRAVDHLYEIFEPYREHERINMIDLAEAIEDAYEVIEGKAVSLEDKRLDFKALEEHVEHLHSVSGFSSHTSNT